MNIVTVKEVREDVNYYLRNATSVFKNSSVLKPNTAITVFSTTETVFIGKDRKPITIQQTKYVNA